MIMNLESVAKAAECKDEKVYSKYGFKIGQVFHNSNGYPFFKIIGKPQIDIQSIYDLIKIMKDFDSRIILSEDSITIYNDYVE